MNRLLKKTAALSVLMLVMPAIHAADTLPHPILSIPSNNGSAANSLLSTYTESQYTNLFTPRYAPRNNGYGFVPAVVPGDTGWSWNINNPTNITSTPSGTVFPSASYPVQTTNLLVISGNTVSAPYYYPAGKTSGQSLVFNLISYNQQNQRDTDLGNLMGAYIGSGSSPQTRNDNYARRIAIELMDWGRWYPNYIMCGPGWNVNQFLSGGPTYQVPQNSVERASDHNGLAHEWTDTPLKAFDAIYDSIELTNLNAEMGYNVRDYITTNIFFFEGDFFENNVPIPSAIGSNLSGPFDTLPEVARVLNRPDYMVWMDQYLSALIVTNVNRDGQLLEGLGYSIGYLNANVTAADNTQYYFISRPATNSQFMAISNRAAVYANTLQYGQSELATIALPNGQLPSFGDTPFDTYFSTRTTGNSAALGGYAHVSMGAGTTASTAVQVNQQYSGNDNHMRSDTTAFTLWAFNNPYLENVRYYNGAIGRNWGELMLEKNSVVVDRTDLTPFPVCETYGNANLTLYEPGNNGLAMTEIDGYRDYSSKASRYQRLMMLNTVDSAKPYVVDVFRVTGGTNHDYTFHGAIRWIQNGQASFPLVTNNNLYPMLEPGDGTWSLTTDTPDYGFFRGVSSNTAPGNFQILYTDTNRATARDTRLWMTTDPLTYSGGSTNYQVYLGWTPVPETNNTVPTNFFNNLGLTRPSTIIRHRVTSAPLSDLFVSVFEPFNVGVSNIVSVTRLPMSNSMESCGLQITFKDGRVDTYIVNLRNPKIAGANIGSATVGTTDGQYALNGRVGFYMDRTNGDSRVLTMNATDFKFPGRELSTPTNTYFSGLISGSTRQFDGAAYNAFTTATPLPAGTALRGKSFSFTHGTLSGYNVTNISEMYKIDQVVLTNGLYNICFTNDHFQEIANGTTSVEQIAPLRTFTTSNSFEIAASVEAQQISPIAGQIIPPGGSSGPLGFTFGNLGSTAGTSLQVFATSTNQTLVPNSNLVLGGSGTNQTITVTPAAGQSGVSLVTITVTDGTWTNSRSFSVSVANFAVTTSPSSQSVLAGNTVNFTNVLAATNGTGTVNFSLSGLPANASASFSPATTTGAGTNVLSVIVSNNVTAGAYPLTISATAGSQVASNTVMLVVNVINSTPGWSTWVGASGTGNFWSDNANWSAPIFSGYSLVFGGISRIVNTNDTTAGTLYSNLVFNAGAGAFNLNGNPVTLGIGITNDSSVPQTILLGLDFNNNVVFNGASNALVIAGGLTNTFIGTTATHLTLEGGGTVSNVPAVASGASGTNFVILDNAAANWTLSGNNSTTVPWILFITNGTFNFGDANDAPGFTSTTTHNTPSDNQLAMVSGANAVFNMVNGTLTLDGPLNTATVLNSTSVVNQVGGTLNFNGSPYYFQGANGGNAGEMSIVNVSGGVMNSGTSANPTDPFYIASRGAGILNLSSNGTLSCGRLDISRNASGNSLSSAGIVNLDGGTLSVTSVTNVSANAQTGGSPTSVFNFNGGTLVAKSGSAQIFFQGSRVAPVMPIQTFVQAGGATIDDGGQTITIGEALQHDPTLGSTLDGGLTKLDTGTLTLVATNTYTGNTTISSGTLALTGGGAITNSGSIYLASNAVLNASGRSDGTLTLAAAQTLFGNGTVAGNFILNGAVSPADAAVGTLTNTGSMTFGGGGRFTCDMNDAIGLPGTNWDFLSISGGLTIQAAATNPFVIQLRSIDLDLNDNNPGASDFGNQAAQSWVIATAAGITNFSAGKFTVDASAFANDLAGGSFSISTNGNSLLLVFTPQPAPPVFGNVSFDGLNYIFTGNGGVTGGNYLVLTSTNLASPSVQWTCIATNSFGAGGSFIFSNAPAAGAPQTFYQLKLQ